MNQSRLEAQSETVEGIFVRVLLVEDTKSDRLLVFTELLHSPTIRTIVQVSSATNAIDLLRDSLDSSKPTIIVLDMSLAHRESGFEVLRYMYHAVDIPVIVWTENNDKLFEQICHWFGVRSVVRKFVGSNRNINAIRHAIEEYAASRNRSRKIVVIK